MIEIRKTKTFQAWMQGLRDDEARNRIEMRLERLSNGNPGSHRVLQGGICELKVDYGPGYRVYYTEHRGKLVLLLCGGDKRTQAQDIGRAHALAAKLD